MKVPNINSGVNDVMYRCIALHFTLPVNLSSERNILCLILILIVQYMYTLSESEA